MWWSRKYREELKEDGWHEYQMQFVADRDVYALRQCSMDTRRNFVKHLKAGEDVIAVYCGERDPVGYWLARCEASSRKSNKVVFNEKSANKDLGI